MSDLRYGTCKPTGDAERDKRRMRDVIAATKMRHLEAEGHQRRTRARVNAWCEEQKAKAK